MAQQSINPAINLAASILLIEDDNDLAELVQMHLKFQGHHVTRVVSIEKGKAEYQRQTFELVILDRGLPDGDGLELCHYLRQQQDWTPVLVLTARDSEMDKVDGLEADVDDYITKPFSVLEFQARVRNVLRRVNQTTDNKARETEVEDALNFGALKIVPALHQVSLNNKDVSLTAMEFSLLQFLATRPGRVYSKDELLDHVWNTNHAGYHHTVCSTINRLRSKLMLSDSEHHFIQTVWGVGYKFQSHQ
ncbi:response regulator transcription factor [Vibrio natriegens]|uniref:response regulator transcription factor n=1 Tax=Vibrio natriegens TaxID=691 RepID=UPI0021E6E3B3|nr:response regulator transcription factor [Vibrio natriegens]UYI49050.1 response regulator transcription factor [Vibrio natriegens]